eukprot:5068826-Amphidinium_carterae.1
MSNSHPGWDILENALVPANPTEGATFRAPMQVNVVCGSSALHIDAPRVPTPSTAMLSPNSRKYAS